MTFYVYIIYSTKLDKYYVGYTENIEIRINQHNQGISTFTAKASDWIIKWKEEQPSRAAAMKREKHIKKQKSRKYIEWLITQTK